MQTTEKLSKLRELLDRADQVYYNDQVGSRSDVMSDDTYDELRRQLAAACPDDPRLTRVGAPVGRGDTIETAEHKLPMGSLNNALNRGELISWYDGLRANHEPFEVVVTAKLDGGSMGLTYSNGVITMAVTRGDGATGEVITANAAMMVGVPLNACNPDGSPFNGYIRGEVLLPKAAFAKISAKDSNPRNLGNGIMRRKSGEQCQFLEFRAFRLYDFQGNIPDAKLSGMFERLKTMGFSIPYIADTSSVKGASWAYDVRSMILTKWALEDGAELTPGMEEDEIRNLLAVEIDGLVVSVDDVNLLGSMGVKNQCPVGEIALKFPPRAAATRLNSVEWELGRTHKLTPVAHLEPVEIGGVIVKKATLCNPEEIKRLKIRIGDQVIVTRQGDVIPKVTGALPDSPQGSKEIEIPTVCPHTGAPVVRRTLEGGKLSADIYADVESGEGSSLTLSVRVKRLEHWAKTVDIKGFGPKTLEAMAEVYPDRGPSAIYEWAGDDVDLPGVSPKVQETLREAVSGALQLSIPQILGGLGIEKLGVRRVEAIITQFPEVFNDLKNWLNDELENHAAELSLPNVAKTIADGLKSNRDELKLLGQNGVRVVRFEPAATPPTGAYVFCLTGTFEVPKAELHDKITAAGHTFETSFKSNVTHVVAADLNSGSSKLKQATSKGIATLDVDGLLALIS